MSSTHTTESTDGDTEVRRAGVFDIRNFIGGLIGFYGVVLLVYGITSHGESHASTGGLNINLWAGIGMTVVAVGFAVWARVRPVIVAVKSEDQPQESAGH
jgi:membrane-bound ClpP family serine protease